MVGWVQLGNEGALLLVGSAKRSFAEEVGTLIFSQAPDFILLCLASHRASANSLKNGTVCPVGTIHIVPVYIFYRFRSCNSLG